MKVETEEEVETIEENMNKEKVIQHRIQNIQQSQYYNADYLATAICKTSPRLQSYIHNN
jgi:2C-methyl-D-erythritol 2,4-cyclodiphosphate synthase